MRKIPLAAIAAALFLSACSDSSTAPGPQAPPSTVNFSAETVDSDHIKDLIEDLFKRGNEKAALKRFRNIERLVDRRDDGEDEDGDDRPGRRRGNQRVRKQVFAFVEFTLRKLEDGRLDDLPGSTAAEGVSALVAALFDFAGITTGAPAIDPAILSGDRDGVVALITPAGGVATTASDFAAAAFPAGALDDDVLLVIGRLAADCLPTSKIQAEGCYEYTLIPPLPQVNPSGTFNVDVTVEVCLLPLTNGQPGADQFTLHKFDPAQAGLGVIELPDVADQNIVCSAFARANQTPVQYFASGLRRGIRTLFAPAWDPPPLYAAHRGLGGLTKSFSDIGWAKSATISKQAGDGQTAPEFTTVQVSALVESLHPQTAPFVGQPVTFTVTGGGGTVGPNQGSSFVVNTDGTGIATVAWNLGPAGSQTLEATSVTDDGPVTFMATATAGSGPIQSSFGSAYFIDGVNADGTGPGNEWANATQITLSGGTLAGATLFIQNDFSNLYMALSVPDASLTTGDLWITRFDATNDDVANAGGEDKATVSTVFQTGFSDDYFASLPLGWGAVDPTQQNGAGAVGNANGVSFFELSKPLASGDGFDFNLGQGSILGICIRHSDDGGALTDFPAGCATDQGGTGQGLYFDVLIPFLSDVVP